MDIADIKKVVDVWCVEFESMGSLDYINHVQIFENKGNIMATSILNFPLAQIVDGMLSFIQHRFSKPEISTVVFILKHSKAYITRTKAKETSV